MSFAYPLEEQLNQGQGITVHRKHYIYNLLTDTNITFSVENDYEKRCDRKSENIKPFKPT